MAKLEKKRTDHTCISLPEDIRNIINDFTEDFVLSHWVADRMRLEFGGKAHLLKRKDELLTQLSILDEQIYIVDKLEEKNIEELGIIKNTLKINKFWWIKTAYVCRKDSSKKQSRISLYNNELGVNLDTTKFNRLILKTYELYNEELKLFAEDVSIGDSSKYNHLNHLRGDTFE